MRATCLGVSMTLAVAAAALAGPDVSPDAFKTNAAFFVDDIAAKLSSAIATIEPHKLASDYSWLRIHFYGFPPDGNDIAAAVKGNVQSMEKKFNGLASNPALYRTSWAAIQLTVDKDANVAQVDMSVPGKGCTIAPFPQEVTRFLQAYRFDRRTLRLKSKGSFVCDMSFMHVPNQAYSWDIDLNDLPVFAKTNP